MLTCLKRNVCDLDDPLIRNNASVKGKIPSDLLYACQFWADHLQTTPIDNEIFRLVEGIFLTKILFWLEVLSLAGLVADAIPALSAAYVWVKVCMHWLTEATGTDE